MSVCGVEAEAKETGEGGSERCSKPDHPLLSVLREAERSKVVTLCSALTRMAV